MRIVTSNMTMGVVYWKMWFFLARPKTYKIIKNRVTLHKKSTVLGCLTCHKVLRFRLERVFKKMVKITY